MRRTLSVLTLVTCFPLVAAAQDPAAPAPAATPAVEGTATPPAGDPLAKENWPLSAADRPAGLSAGMLQVDVGSFTSLAKDAVAKPIAFPLAAYYGVTNELQLGLVPASIVPAASAGL